MNKSTLIQTYSALLALLQLQPHELVLHADSACVMLDLRATARALDVEVAPSLLDSLKKFEPVHAAWDCVINLRASQPGPTQMVEGVCCYSTQRLLRQKRLQRCSKNHADIAALMPLLY